MHILSNHHFSSTILFHWVNYVPEGGRRTTLLGLLVLGSAASISFFQFRYDIDMIFTKYRDIDIDIEY